MLESDFAGIWISLGLNHVSGRLRGFDFASGRVDDERLVVVVFATDTGDGDALDACVGDFVVDGAETCWCAGECVGGWLERK